VQASGNDANHCAINLNSTGLGTLSGATLTYTGSTSYINYLRLASYLAPELDTLTTALYTAVLANGGSNPSQYQEASSGYLLGSPWLLWTGDIYGYYSVGQCSGCTVSGSTLTLGGTVTNIFRVGDALLGGGVPANTLIMSCTKVGSGPCGSNSGDTLGLSQSLTISTPVAMTGNAVPPANNAANSTTSPVRAWGAICRWNNNASQCNGWLLKRDLDPASNDNDPMWLQKAA